MHGPFKTAKCKVDEIIKIILFKLFYILLRVNNQLKRQATPKPVGPLATWPTGFNNPLNSHVVQKQDAKKIISRNNVLEEKISRIQDHTPS